MKESLTSPKTSKIYGIFAGLDIGTEKVSCAIGSLKYDFNNKDENLPKVPHIFLSGFGQRASRGINIYGISDLDALEDSILNAVYAAEELAQKNIKEVYVNIPTHLVQTRKIVTKLSLSGQTPIQSFHLRKLFNTSKNIPINDSQYIIHIWPLSYQLDDITNIQDPTGMIGKDLSAICYVVITSKSYIQNITHCIGRCNLDIAGFIVDSYAAGLACLVNDEAELGATLIDIGGKSTQIACFYAGKLIWLESIPIGGFHITSDLARGLSMTLSQAERIKTLYGSLVLDSQNSAEQVPITQMGMQSGPNIEYVSRGIIFEIIKARVDEIFENIISCSKKVPTEVIDVVFQKILLTGGACHLPGLVDLAEEKFNAKVRLAFQAGVEGQDSILKSLTFSTCAGLLCYASQDYTGHPIAAYDKKPLNFWQRLSLWFNEHV